MSEGLNILEGKERKQKRRNIVPACAIETALKKESKNPWWVSNSSPFDLATPANST